MTSYMLKIIFVCAVIFSMHGMHGMEAGPSSVAEVVPGVRLQDLDLGAIGALMQQLKKKKAQLVEGACLDAIETGDVGELGKCVSKGFNLAAFLDKRGCSAMLIAAENGQGAMVRYLAEKHRFALDNVEIDGSLCYTHEQRHITPLMMAAGGVDIARIPEDAEHPLHFLLDGFWRFWRDESCEHVELCEHVKCEHVKCEHVKCEHGKAESHWQDIDGSTALHYAARYGRTNNAWYLLMNNAPYDTCDSDGQTFIDIARKYKHEEFVDVMSEHFKERLKTLQLVNFTERAETLHGWCQEQRLISMDTASE